MEELTENRTNQSYGMLTVRILIRLVIFIVSLGALLFLAAGTISWVRGWIYLGLWTFTTLVNTAILFAVNPAIIVTRMEGQRPKELVDKILASLAIPATLITPVLAGLDAVRYKLTTLPFWWTFGGITLHLVGDIFMVWSIAANPFGEKIVRIQNERGHHVITTGPYAIVRHPMYLGTLLLIAGMPLVLGSLWIFLTIGVMSVLLIVRTAWEDRLLQRDLPGYEEYTHKTKYRLLPGVW
jgi:protein-S-isoprenylcysteine O-methyltransferase Ste14